MKPFLPIGLLCALVAIGCHSRSNPPATPATVIQLNHEPTLSTEPQTVRTKLTQFSLDGYPTIVFLCQFGASTVGVEVITAKPMTNYRPTDSSRLKVETILKNKERVAASFSLQPGIQSAGDRNDRQVAEFRRELKASDIDQVILTVDGKPYRFVLVDEQKKF